MKNNYFVEIAGLRIKIKHINNVSLKIIEDLNAKKDNDNNSYDIALNIVNKNIKDYKATIFSAKGSMNFNADAYFVDYLFDVNYIVKNIFNNKNIDITINTSKSSLKKKIKSLFSNKALMMKNTILSYSLFWYILHIKLLQKNKSFLHAGVFDLNGNASIITGTGGCGKTSTLFKILEDKDSSYIAEDFGIIDKNGYTYYNPKPVSIYASDMEFGQSILTNYFNKFTNSEQWIWSIKRNLLKINPMIKSKPNLLMDNKICQKSKIKNVIYFVRNNNQSLKIEDIKLNELTERILDASMRELKTLNELIQLIRANAPLSFNIPSFEDIRYQTKEIYLEAFKDTNNKIIYIPHKTKPDELVQYLKDKEII